MKTILIAALASVLTALAQSPRQVIRLNEDQADHAAFFNDALDQAQALRYQTLEKAGITVGKAPSQLKFIVNQGTVKNAPYSADAVTETTQILGDGNRIEQSTTQKLYRDNDGRERREESMLAMGALAQPGAPRTITITDPMERLTYTLDPQKQTATRSPGVRAVFTGFVTMPKQAVGANNTPVKEDLGAKNIEGVTAQGTRATETIPAGQIGNLAPINVVDEVWYSPDLQMNVLTTHSDPRTGQTVYKLINISRANPPKSLFEPPAGYAVTGPAAPAAAAPVFRFDQK